MRAGRRYSAFAIKDDINEESRVSLGVIRPIRAQALARSDLERCALGIFHFKKIINSERNSRWIGDIHVCQYNSEDGSCRWTDLGDTSHAEESWVGMEGKDPSQEYCEVGLLLDLGIAPGS